MGLLKRKACDNGRVELTSFSSTFSHLDMVDYGLYHLIVFIRT